MKSITITMMDIRKKVTIGGGLQPSPMTGAESFTSAATTRTNIMPLHNRQSSVSHHSLNSIIEHPENNKDKLKNRRASNAIGMGQDYSNDGSHDELGRQR